MNIVKGKIKYLFLFILVASLIIIKVNADPETVDISMNTDCTLQYTVNESQGGARELQVNINDITPGKRLTDIKYCLQSNNCNVENNWSSVTSYDSSNEEITSLGNSVGTNDFTFWFRIPNENIKLKAVFTDFEPMDISYSKYLGNEYSDDVKDINKYEDSYANIVTGYKGGDIILPSDCTSNGCLLKVTMSKENYNAINARLDYYNENLNTGRDKRMMVDVYSMFNHLETVGSDSLFPMYVDYDADDNHKELYLDETENDISFYLVVNKYFSERNRSNFTVGDNRNRVLSEDYIGLNYKVDSKYFDEGTNDGFLSFTEFNEYYQNANIFYGTPEIQFSVDSVRPLSLANGGQSNMGTLKNVYSKIVSKNPEVFPINNQGKLTITSFYNPDYIVELSLKNQDNETVRDVTLNLSRFAFADELIVDSEGRNCRDPHQNPDCQNGDNAYLSTEYRGLYDTFYSDGTTSVIDAFELSRQDNGIMGRTEHDLVVFNRNLDFNPWAVAVYYSGDKVVATKSFDLGELTKIEGYSEEKIDESEVNGIALDNNELITDYNSNDYNVFGYGLGYEIPINKVKYFYSGNYERSNLNCRLILGSRNDLIENNINRIALFLTNGELKSDEDKFPELKYGVGEGKIFYIDHRTFDRLDGGFHEGN